MSERKFSLASAVIRAVYDLQGREGARKTWPTAERVAAYLDAPADEVLRVLREFKQKRLFTDRRRHGERVWMPWGEP